MSNSSSTAGTSRATLLRYEVISIVAPARTIPRYVPHDQHVPGTDQDQPLITLSAGSGEVVYHATSAAGTVAPLESTE